jgi:cell wall-associated NlpC family hydrolase
MNKRREKIYMTYGIILLCVWMIILPSGMDIYGSSCPVFPIINHDEKSMDDNKTVPECVVVGDLLLLDIKSEESNPWKRPGSHNEHAAIYIGNNTLVDATAPYVRMKNYSHYYDKWQKNLAFVRVKTANESQRQAAVDWAVRQIGMPYQVFFDIPWFGLKIVNPNFPFPTADKLYCMELPWIAYYRQGIDIDRNGWRFPRWVTGNDILYDDDIEVIYEEVQNSTEFVKPYKGVYIGNRQIAITLNRTIVYGNIDIEVITQNDLIIRMDLYIDGEYEGTDTTVPFAWRWNERRSGRSLITAVAYDAEGNHYSTSIAVQKYF